MAELNQSISNEKYYMGWYGTCESDCTNIEISSSDFRDKIYKIFQTREDNVGYRSFDGTVPQNFDSIVQHFTHLECGKSYLIILKKGEGKATIPHFVETKDKSGDSGRVIPECVVEQTPTPTPTPEETPTPTPEKTPTPTPEQTPTPTPVQTPTPTPEQTPTPTPEQTPTPTPEKTPTPTPEQTPTPTPEQTPTPTPVFECCDPTHKSVRPNQPSENNLTFKGDINGTLCWQELTGIKRPTTYSCRVNGTDFKIVITSNITNNKFRLIMDNGDCYETTLVYSEFEETNQFEKIN